DALDRSRGPRPAARLPAAPARRRVGAGRTRSSRDGSRLVTAAWFPRLKRQQRPQYPLGVVGHHRMRLHIHPHDTWLTSIAFCATWVSELRYHTAEARMTTARGFQVDIAELRGFSRRLMRLATGAGSVADALAGVTADTGRADSDEMGRLA